MSLRYSWDTAIGLLLVAMCLPATLRGQVRSPDVVIGAIDGPEALTEVREIHVRGDYLYVSQFRDASVRLFSPDGEPVGMLGGKGEGPGEFRIPMRMGWRGDSLWVFDPGLGRVSLFTPDGRFMTSFVAVYDPEEYPFIASGPVGILDDRVMVVRLEVPTNALHEITGAVPIVRVTVEGQVLDTIGRLPGENRSLRVPISYRGADMYVVREQPFTDDPLWAITPDGERMAVVIRSGSNGPTDVRVVMIATMTGERLFERRIPAEGRELGARTVDLFLDTLLASFPRELTRKEASEIREAFRTELYLPRYLPLVEDMFLDSLGRTWLAITDGEASHHWLVLDESGVPVGDVTIAADVRLRQATVNHVWGIRAGPLGAPQVVRMRFSVTGPTGSR